jgi:hypothetical protein
MQLPCPKCKNTQFRALPLRDVTFLSNANKRSAIKKLNLTLTLKPTPTSTSTTDIDSTDQHKQHAHEDIDAMIALEEALFKPLPDKSVITRWHFLRFVCNNSGHSKYSISQKAEHCMLHYVALPSLPFAHLT